MKKVVFFIFTIMFVFTACEKDDICVEETTPNLKIKFYSFEDENELKEVTLDSIYLQNYDVVENTVNVTVDSILVPLDLTTDITTLILVSNSTVDTLAFTYLRTNEFVSRSCGFKTVFEDLTLSKSTNNWIKSATINTQTIENEQQTHLTIYH